MTTVVTFRADQAEERVARFREWAGPGADVADLGVLDGVRRYRVDAERWAAYSRALTPSASRRKDPNT